MSESGASQVNLWKDAPLTRPRFQLPEHFSNALQFVWSHPRVWQLDVSTPMLALGLSICVAGLIGGLDRVVSGLGHRMHGSNRNTHFVEHLEPTESIFRALWFRVATV